MQIPACLTRLFVEESLCRMSYAIATRLTYPYTFSSFHVTYLWRPVRVHVYRRPPAVSMSWQEIVQLCRAGDVRRPQHAILMRKWAEYVSAVDVLRNGK